MITRGIKHKVDKFINELSAKYLPYTMAKSSVEGKDQKGLVQTAVRPIQLWEVVFPEEHLEIMQNTLFREWGAKPQHKRHGKFITMIRKVLGVKKLPPYEYDAAKVLPVDDAGVERTGIGYKEDYKQNGVEML